MRKYSHYISEVYLQLPNSELTSAASGPDREGDGGKAEAGAPEALVTREHRRRRLESGYGAEEGGGGGRGTQKARFV